MSGEEKRLAKAIINTFEREERLLTLAELTQELGLPSERVRTRLDFLAEAGLLQPSSSPSPRGPTPVADGLMAPDALAFTLAANYARWGGPLRYNFHTITIGEEKPFEVW